MDRHIWNALRRRGRNLAGRAAEHLPATIDATQASLLRRIDVSGYNVQGPPSLSAVKSQACSAGQILEPVYATWVGRLGQTRRFHRKQWEYVIALEAAEQAGLLRPGCSALGFGVGTEPIPAILAAMGLDVLATDQAAENAGQWAEREEHASSVEALQWPAICEPDILRAHVRFLPVDMNDIPGDLGTHDLVWSSCAMEHLGSPQAGFDFVFRSLHLLRPGGLAVHTTEFDMTPGPTAVDYGNCALYRLADLERLRDEAVGLGFAMDINPYVAFEHPADRAIAPPGTTGKEEFHLKLSLFDSVSTSFAIVIRRPA